MSTLLRSPATGTVWQFAARLDEPLAAGTVALYVESMKMEIPATLPRAGRIKAWLVREGDAVEEGQPLAELG
ncbi:acetyl-CoA carboxylase biotin carboxyl carrier protein subunit [Solimonas soli]|uniref:acetyl-CoA carboxylase biotin carboxyl carrier protein subunit n=1 Tax=Solimonas soli TaxID=413479 RepID=UPI000488CF2D|nr:acetyl-CoA carboxylase biotin carboxyl carrier protein subunit [Solimonas soli]